MSASRCGDLPGGGAGEPWPGPAGWFGKLRALGDFASRRLPPEFIEPWDEWLSEQLLAARQALGESWDEVYANAPAWRFALTAGVLGNGPWFGVLMPSFDRVGRQYPLTFAAGFDPHAVPLGAWWSRLIGIAERVNGDPAWDLHALEAALQAPGCNDPKAEEQFRQQFAPALSGAAPGCSLWWLGRRAQAGTEVLVLAGLPAGEHFIRLLEG